MDKSSGHYHKGSDQTASSVTVMPAPAPTFKVAVPDVAPPVKPLPAVTPVISPVLFV